MGDLKFVTVAAIPNLQAYQNLVHGILDDERTETSEFTFNTPLYKASAPLKELLQILQRKSIQKEV